jgi:Zn finger protein HypA/HybF involved in hydrogenase expression
MERKSQMMKKRDNRQIIQDFRLRQTRQFLAIAVTLVLLLFFALIHKRVDLFGEISKNTIFAAQAVIIAAFIGFSFVNWRCPSCDKYLGSNINKHTCKHCGTRLR